ncbi:MAG TPA: ATP-binding protein, partial [Novosphingobium sp.]|nr:ATP-binding protein [Novosphingobium sp.]
FHEGVVVLSFLGGVAVLGALALKLGADAQARPVPALAQPDWSVTVAAMERPDTAVAVVDRAGRLVCASSLWESWFSLAHAPLAPGLDGPSQAAMQEAARQALRDGAAGAVALRDGSGRQWQASVKRCGRAEDFLIWQAGAVVRVDPLAQVAQAVTGAAGALFAEAGFAAALVSPEGRVHAANEAFLHHAGTQADFALLLTQDEHARVYWASDSHRTRPLIVYCLPLAGGEQAPALMLLVEHGQGVGAAGMTAGAAPHLEALLAPLPLGLAMADRDGRLLFANAAFMRAAGHEGEAPPVWPIDLVVREDKAALADAVRRFAQGAVISGDVAVRLAAQPEDPVTMSLAGVRGLGEAAVLLSLIDTTEEARLKRQVAQATKMQAVGQLAGGVAHDFNNVLTAIIGTCDLMLLRHTPGDSDYDDIQQIRASSNRAASLTRQLLAFSRQQTLRPEVLQLPDIVSEISQMLRRLIGEKIQLVVTHDRDLGPVRADPTQLEQVIVNLVVNARDAMNEHALRHGGANLTGGSGRLTLATRRITAEDVRALRSEILPLADYTALVVEDTGGGIPPEVLGKIWEPFFTTKEQGKGTGLGLSTVYGIVKQSGGFIFASNVMAPGGGPVGARFTVYLPVHHGAEAAARPVREEAATWAGGGDILLVEDEDSVRVVAERALTRAGYS